MASSVLVVSAYTAGFLRCFRDPFRAPRIENRVARVRENRVRRIKEIGSLQVHTESLTFSFKKTVIQ